MATIAVESKDVDIKEDSLLPSERPDDWKEDDSLAEEDRLLKERLETALDVLLDGNATIPLRTTALRILREDVRSSTSSMTAVPKPLKYLEPYYERIKRSFLDIEGPQLGEHSFPLESSEDPVEAAKAAALVVDGRNWGESAEPSSGAGSDAALANTSSASASDSGSSKNNKKKQQGAASVHEAMQAPIEGVTAVQFRRSFADLLSVLAMVGGRQNRECLRFKLLGHPADVGHWGHEHTRALAGEISQEYQERLRLAEERMEEGEDEIPQDIDVSSLVDASDLLALAARIVPFNMAHNAEAEAVDLLLETGRLRTLPSSGFIDKRNVARVCLYLVRCADYTGDEEERIEILSVAYALYLQQARHADAMRVALRMADKGRVLRAFRACRDKGVRLQLGFLLGQHGFRAVGHGADEVEEEEDDAVEDEFGDEELGQSTPMVSTESTTGSAAAGGSAPPAVPLSITLSKIESLTFGAGVLDDKQAGELEDEVKDAIGNCFRHKHYRALAQEMGVDEPKSSEQVYKTKLTDDSRLSTRGRDDSARLDSARGNLAASYVSGFVNLALGRDKVITQKDEHGREWWQRQKGNGMTAAAAGHALLNLWDYEALNEAERFTSASDAEVRAGGVLGYGIIPCCIASEDDASIGMLDEYIAGEAAAGKSHAERCAGLQALGLAYAGSGRMDVAEMLLPYVEDLGADMKTRLDCDLVCNAAFSLGMVLAGTADDEAANALQTVLLEPPEPLLEHPLRRHLAVALGMIYMQRGVAAEDSLEIMAAAGQESPLGREAALLLRACAFAGTGDVLQVQRMLHACAEHPMKDRLASVAKMRKERTEIQTEQRAREAQRGDPGQVASGGAAAAGENESDDDLQRMEDKAGDPSQYAYQSVAAMCLGIITMGEGLGTQMLGRVVDHLLQYGDPAVRRGVPLALAMAYASNADYTIIDTLSKLSHDADAGTSRNAILAMGIVGAGTNNSRLAGMLRQLSAFNKQDGESLFIVRLAQGMLSMGQGLVTVHPFHSDGTLLKASAAGALLAVMLCGLDLEKTILAQHHLQLFNIIPAISPRMVITLDAKDFEEMVKVDVRVGTAVETVGQAGRPKTITGFQTHQTPVLLATKDRAEMAPTDQWVPLSSTLEGVVLLRRVEDASMEDAVRAAGVGEVDEDQRKAVESKGSPKPARKASLATGTDPYAD